MRYKLVGCKSYGLRKVWYCRRKLPLIKAHESPVRVGIGMLRIQADHLIVVLHRMVVISLTSMGITPII